MYGAETKRWSICGEKKKCISFIVGFPRSDMNSKAYFREKQGCFIVKSRIKAHFQQTWISETKLTPYDDILQ